MASSNASWLGKMKQLECLKNMKRGRSIRFEIASAEIGGRSGSSCIRNSLSHSARAWRAASLATVRPLHTLYSCRHMTHNTSWMSMHDMLHSTSWMSVCALNKQRVQLLSTLGMSTGAVPE